MPSGPFEQGHRSLQSGLRAWVERQTRHPLGYVEQLYTFADRDRTMARRPATPSRSAIWASPAKMQRRRCETGWRDWYATFLGRIIALGLPASSIERRVDPTCRRGRRAAASAAARSDAATRSFAFGLDGCGWNEELVLQRYELLYEAALVPEAMERAPHSTALVRRRRPMRPIIAASSPPASRGCAPRSNIGRSCSN